MIKKWPIEEKTREGLIETFVSENLKRFQRQENREVKHLLVESFTKSNLVRGQMRTKSLMQKMELPNPSQRGNRRVTKKYTNMTFHGDVTWDIESIFHPNKPKHCIFLQRQIEKCITTTRPSVRYFEYTVMCDVKAFAVRNESIIHIYNIVYFHQ